jgi:hypothetical protein
MRHRLFRLDGADTGYPSIETVKFQIDELCAHHEALFRKHGHGINSDTDRCFCGEEIVYFEDGDDNDQVGHGCMGSGLVFTHPTERLRGR